MRADRDTQPVDRRLLQEPTARATEQEWTLPMTKPDVSPDAPVDALTTPLDEIPWRTDARPEPAPTKPPRPWKTWIGIGTTSVFVLGVGVMGASAGPETPRLAKPGCIFHTVVKGDTVWRIAGKAGITLDVAARLNPQIQNLNAIEVGDQIATSCGTNEVQRATLAPARAITAEPWEGMAPWPGFNKWLPGDGQDGVVSQAKILRALHDAGATGDQLILLAAVTEGESNRRLAAVGDTTIMDATWGPSVGPWQIRTMKAKTGTGEARDIKVASTLEGGARAAVEIYNAAAAKGDPMKPWGAYTRGHTKSFVGPYSLLAARMGLI